MGFTPNEMRNQEFSRSMRGFAPGEVEAFKEAAASALEEARSEILKLTEERDSYKNRYEELKNIEQTLKNVVVEAQKNADNIIENAKKEADLIVQQAHQRRDEAIEQKHRKLADLDSRVHEIEFTRRSFYSRLKAEIEAHLKLMDQVNIPRRENPPPQPQPQQQPPLAEKSEEQQTPPEQPNESPGNENKNEQETANVSEGQGGDDIDRIVDQFRNDMDTREE